MPKLRVLRSPRVRSLGLLFPCTAARAFRPLAWLGLALFAVLPTSGALAETAPPPVARSQAEAGAGAPEFDPLQGMDPSGRIPKIEKPDSLVHPERWRYIPEGRIKPGNFFQRFLVTSFVIPFVFRDADVGTGVGLGVTDVDFRQQRRREFAGLFLSYTTKGQQSFFGAWRRWLNTMDLAGGGVLQEERSFIGVSGGYQKTLTRRFFGFGPGSNEEDEVKYVDEVFELEIEGARAYPDPGSDLVLGLGVRGEFHELSADCDEQLSGAQRMLCDDPIFDESAAFQQLIGDSDHEQLGWLTASVRWDTRDSTRNPYKGFYVGVLTELAALQDERDVGARYTVRAGKTFKMPPLLHAGGDDEEQNPPTDTLAFGFQSQLKSGRIPFSARPTLGGSATLRGYIDGRFRDDASWHAGAEYRFWVIPRGFRITRSIRVERVGIAPFFEMGSVGDDGFELFESQVKLSYGIGLRALLERAAPFRVDLGFSDEGVNISARFGYTF